MLNARIHSQRLDELFLPFILDLDARRHPDQPFKLSGLGSFQGNFVLYFQNGMQTAFGYQAVGFADEMNRQIAVFISSRTNEARSGATSGGAWEGRTV